MTLYGKEALCFVFAEKFNLELLVLGASDLEGADASSEPRPRVWLGFDVAAAVGLTPAVAAAR